MTHQICDACECVSLCSKSGCRPLVPMDQAPVVTSSTDPKYLREALDKTFELLVRERGVTKELVAALRTAEPVIAQYMAEAGGCDHSADICCCIELRALADVRAALMKVPQ